MCHMHIIDTTYENEEKCSFPDVSISLVSSLFFYPDTNTHAREHTHMHTHTSHTNTHTHIPHI